MIDRLCQYNEGHMNVTGERIFCPPRAKNTLHPLVGPFHCSDVEPACESELLTASLARLPKGSRRKRTLLTPMGRRWIVMFSFFMKWMLSFPFRLTVSTSHLPNITVAYTRSLGPNNTCNARSRLDIVLSHCVCRLITAS